MQLSLLLALTLANRGGGAGAAVLYNYAWILFTLPYGVVAIPIATSAFTTLSVRHSEQDSGGYNAVLAVSSRASMVITAALATALAAAAAPVAAVFAQNDPLPLERALLSFAPGIVGFGLVALLSKALYASHHGREAAAAQVVGWITVMGSSTALVMAAPPDWTVAALGAGTSAGLTLAAALLVAVALRAHGRAAFAGLGRGAMAVVGGAVAGYLAGAAVIGFFDMPGVWQAAGASITGGAAAVAAFGVVAAVVDAGAVRAAFSRRTNNSAAQSAVPSATDEGNRP